MKKTNKDMCLISGAMVLSGGVPSLLYAWRLSQAVVMATRISHEIDASRLRLTTKLRFGNPTDMSRHWRDMNLNVSCPIIKLFYNQKLLFTSSETDQNFKLIIGTEKCFNPICAQILRQSIPDLFMEYEGQGTVNMTAEIKTLINKKIPCIRNIIVRI